MPSIPAPRTTSKLGRASLTIAIGIFSLVVLSVVALIVLLEVGSKSDNVGVGIALVAWILAPGGHFIGLVLGIIDVCRKRSKKMVPVLGIIANAVLGGVGFTVLIYILNLLFHSLGSFR